MITNLSPVTLTALPVKGILQEIGTIFLKGVMDEPHVPIDFFPSEKIKNFCKDLVKIDLKNNCFVNYSFKIQTTFF